MPAVSTVTEASSAPRICMAAAPQRSSPPPPLVTINSATPPGTTYRFPVCAAAMTDLLLNWNARPTAGQNVVGCYRPYWGRSNQKGASRPPARYPDLGLLHEHRRRHVGMVFAGNLELSGIVEGDVAGISLFQVGPVLLPVEVHGVQPGH